MEDRLAGGGSRSRGLALMALAAIAAITLAWWALALWPAGDVEPQWLARTRAACFGSAHGGLPDAGGWILLIGEPIGMVATLIFLFGDSLRRDVRALREHRAWRIAALSVVAVACVVTGVLARQLARALGAGADISAGAERPRVANGTLPAIVLEDQRGEHVSLAHIGGSVVTFAFGHCTTVCPAGVAALMSARRRTGRDDLSIVVITLDPWRDTPDRLPTLAAHFGLARHDRVLSGSVDDVTRALAALGVAIKRNDTNGDVEHVASAMLIDASGRITRRIDGPPFGLGTLLERN